ncbi:hypothetical protein [Streptomyces sp. NPDC018693]|uniref:hypothetical protein n=1 Tax=unclassified Streptomyces TaxID=2593676 RepID=UPI0037A83647
MSITMEITPEVLAVLGLPARETLDDEQQRGAACVWCNHELNAESAIDLGEQAPPDRWFPRACRPCVGVRAWPGVLSHAMACTSTCGGQSGHLCDTGRLLYRLSTRHWVHCERCGQRIEPGQEYDEYVPESGTGFPPTVYTHREPCERPPRRWP